MEILKERYFKKLRIAFKEKHGIKNIFAIPQPIKITVNMGLGEALKDSNIVDILAVDLTSITGQKAVKTKAKKSVADFELRKGDVIGLKVTLRHDRMWHFLDKLINVVLPRIKDFRGVSPTAFDKAGNYTLGITEHIVFPEIDPTKVTKTKGLSVGIGFNTKSPELNKEMLSVLGFIFKE